MTAIETIRLPFAIANKISVLSDRSFSGLVSLSELICKHNRVAQLEAAFFGELKSLRFMDFSKNGLRSFSRVGKLTDFLYV